MERHRRCIQGGREGCEDSEACRSIEHAQTYGCRDLDAVCEGQGGACFEEDKQASSYGEKDAPEDVLGEVLLGDGRRDTDSDGHRSDEESGGEERDTGGHRSLAFDSLEPHGIEVDDCDGDDAVEECCKVASK